MSDEAYMLLAIEEAKKAELMDEVPIGCIVVKDIRLFLRLLIVEKIFNKQLRILKSLQ